MAGDNSPCTITRVIERTAERIAAVAKTLESGAVALRQNMAAQSAGCGNIATQMERDAKELRQCAFQLTGKAY